MADTNALHHTDISEILALRQYIYQLFHCAFSSSPTNTHQKLFTCDLTEDCFEAFLSASKSILSNQLPYEAERDFIPASIKVLDLFSEASLAKLKHDYAAIFEMPGKQKVPFWESYYITGDHLFIQEQTLTIRKEYIESGLIPSMLYKVPDDSLALEMDYMKTLSDKAFEYFQNQNFDEYSSIISTSKGFIEAHLHKWIPKMLNTATENLPGNSYSLLISLLNNFIILDSATLSGLIND